MPVWIYRKSNQSLSFKGENDEKVFKAFPVGVVPYEWIEHIDLEGDEYGYVPLFYCHFKGRTRLFFNYPYKRTVYYRESEVYHEGNDPADMKYSLIYDPISSK